MNDGVWADSPSGLLTIYRRDLPFRDEENCESEALDSPYDASPQASSLALLFGEPGGVIVTSGGPSLSISCLRRGDRAVRRDRSERDALREGSRFGEGWAGLYSGIFSAVRDGLAIGGLGGALDGTTVAVSSREDLSFPPRRCSAWEREKYWIGQGCGGLSL